MGCCDGQGGESSCLDIGVSFAAACTDADVRGSGLFAGVDADGALELGALGGVLAGRQAHRQRVLGQHREGLGRAHGQGGQ